MRMIVFFEPDLGDLIQLAIKRDGGVRALGKSRAKVFGEFLRLLREFDVRVIGQTHYACGREATNFRRLNRQFGKDALVNSANLPAGIKTGSRFEGVALKF